MAWRSEILNGVMAVRYAGATPGYIIVYGDSSDAILTSDTGETLIAAGELGRGRVVVFSHEVFVKSYTRNDLMRNNSTLLENVRSWVNGGRNSVIVDVNRMQDLESIPQNGFLVWAGGNKNTSTAMMQQMLDYVRDGGSLVCGVCPWGYAQVNHITVEEMPINFILKELGMCYATYDEYFSAPDQIMVRDNCADVARFDRALDLLKRGGDLSKVKKVLRNVGSIPLEAYPDIKPEIEALGRSYPSIPPTSDKPARSEEEKLVATLMCQVMIKEGMAGHVVVADGVNELPGTFENQPRLETVRVTIEGKEKQCVPTGCYLPAGTELTLSWNVLSGASSGWSVVVGAHTDELYNVADPLRRWPKVSMKKALNGGFVKLCNPFGGQVYLQSPERQGKLRVSLDNVVPSPRFTYETAKDWESVEAKKPGLWCDISGDLITFTLPSKSVRHLKDLGASMRHWDDVVRSHIDLRGIDPSRGRGQWVVTDEQPSVGYMHSGYPIVTHLDVADPNRRGSDPFLLFGDSIPNPTAGGFWGMFHELGHNFQDPSWTWSGTGEVTVNIFTMHAFDAMSTRKPWEHDFVKREMQKAKRYLDGGADYEKWKKDAFLALYIYAQQARDFGWDAFKRVFKEYEALPDSAKPKSEEDKITEWMKRFSLTTGRNQCPAFEFWGFPHTDEAVKSVKQLPPYLPSDEITKDMSPQRAKDITMKYMTM
ncbi:TRPM8 channel-associated factor homolog [Lineus longissimus]|uniref:TRPM8 channel-associated factor homolog n=1 Tax=Lineus longissimus TaxID=88925 RepID=UPI002B4DAFB8